MRPKLLSSNQETSISVTPLDPSSVLTLDEVAARLRVSRRAIYEKTRKRCANPIPSFRVGKAIRFNWFDVSRWIEQNKRGAA
jgi:excisionase family DNA binding protein